MDRQIYHTVSSISCFGSRELSGEGNDVRHSDLFSFVSVTYPGGHDRLIQVSRRNITCDL